MTDQEMIEQFKKEHLQTYKKAIKETVRNNTEGLMNDIFSLIKKPPLDSMDMIKNKLLSLAKKEQLILDTETLNQLIEEFRRELRKNLSNFKNIRIDFINEIVESFNPERETQIISITQKELNKVNKLLKNYVKEQVSKDIDNLKTNLNTIYKKETSMDQRQDLNKQFMKYMNGSYQKQLLDNINMKTMIKDRTLISGINEQGERYLFTKNNSHLFEVTKNCKK